MVVAPPQVQELSSVDRWFHTQTDSLQLLAQLPELSTVRDVLQQHLPSRVQRLSRHIAKPQDASNWLQIILKSGELIRLWPSPEKPVTVAVNCSSNLKLAQEQLDLVRSPEFCHARQTLGINKYWFLIVSGYPLQVPKRSELLDTLYAQLAKDEECSIVQIGAPVS